MSELVELVKIAALALLVALLCLEWFSPLTSATVGAGVLYLLCVRISRPPSRGGPLPGLE